MWNCVEARAAGRLDKNDANTKHIPDDKEFECKVEEITWQQDKMISTRSIWEVVEDYQFSDTSVIVIHLCVLAVQCFNFESVCKTQTVIHTQAQNRLKERSVNMLLFCYVNL